MLVELAVLVELVWLVIVDVVVDGTEMLGTFNTNQVLSLFWPFVWPTALSPE